MADPTRTNGHRPPGPSALLPSTGLPDGPAPTPTAGEGSEPGPSGVRPDRPSRRIAWTAAELLSAEFPPPRWAVPGVLAEGVNLLAGPPKVGKSWLALALAVAVATGGKALGSIDVEAGPVLYLALEDTGRRLQSRLGKALADRDTWPDALSFAIEWPPLTSGGDARLAAWLDEHPSARLVIVDVFAKLRGTVPPGLSAYDADYLSMSRIKAVADHYGVAVLLIHHTRKMTSDDFLTDVSGTNGLAGAADATLVLRRTRGEADGVLHVVGRDVDEAQYAMAFYPDLGTWQMLDKPAGELGISDTAATILAHLRSHEGDTPKQISDGTGLNYGLVKKTVGRMADKGQLDTDGRGRYFVPADGEAA
ncbi:AAA family ATPase [Actinomadura sp. KC216]|uniref:AAA family ATPase n=1 Tax=Actinomadura sp. KC216 TaxID=2530370 RepID=UPI001A9FBD29|nr:AAA family ATPase [Actinomadura sp. KC216]